jgi:hypothetical protein
MHFLASIMISGLLMGMPLAFGFDVAKPPENLTGWILFVISLCGLLGLMNTFMTRFILRPIIREELKAVPTRVEFIAHDNKDTDFQKKVEHYMDGGPHLKDRY